MTACEIVIAIKAITIALGILLSEWFLSRENGRYEFVEHPVFEGNYRQDQCG